MPSLNQLVRSKLLTTALTNLVTPLTALIVTPLLARELGPAGRGEFAALTVTIIVLGIVGTGGLQDAFNHFVAKKELSSGAALRLAWMASLPLSIVTIAVVVLLSKTLFQHQPAVSDGILWLAILIPVHIQVNMLQGVMLGRGDLKTVNIIAASQAIARMAVTVVACLILDLSAFWAAVILLASYVPGYLVMHWRIMRGRGEPAGFVPAKTIMAFGATSIAAVLASMSSLRLTQILGLTLIGPENLGYYAAAASIAELPLIIAQAGRTVLLANPQLARDPAAGFSTLRRTMVLSLIGCAGVGLVAPFFVPLYLGREFDGAIVPVIVLSAGTLLATLGTLLSALLMISGRPGLQSRAIAAGALVGVAALIPLSSFGAVGAAWATVAGYLITALIAVWDSRKGLNLRFRHLFGVRRSPADPVESEAIVVK